LASKKHRGAPDNESSASDVTPIASKTEKGSAASSKSLEYIDDETTVVIARRISLSLTQKSYVGKEMQCCQLQIIQDKCSKTVIVLGRTRMMTR